MNTVSFYLRRLRLLVRRVIDRPRGIEDRCEGCSTPLCVRGEWSEYQYDVEGVLLCPDCWRSLVEHP